MDACENVNKDTNNCFNLTMRYIRLINDPYQTMTSSNMNL